MVGSAAVGVDADGGAEGHQDKGRGVVEAGVG